MPSSNHVTSDAPSEALAVVWPGKCGISGLRVVSTCFHVPLADEVDKDSSDSIDVLCCDTTIESTSSSSELLLVSDPCHSA